MNDYIATPETLAVTEASIAWDVVTEMDVISGGGPIARQWRRETRNALAYREFRLGLRWFETYDRHGLHIAERHFKASLALDGKFVTPWIWLASVQLQRLSLSFEQNPESSLNYYEGYVQQASQLSSQVSSWFAFTKGSLLRYSGQFDEGMRMQEAHIGLLFDDLDAAISHALHLCFAGRYDEAQTHCARAQRLYPGDLPSCQCIYGFARLLQGSYADALVSLERSVGSTNTGARPRARSILAYAYAVTGQPRRAQQALASLLQLEPNWSRVRLQRAMPFSDPAQFTVISDTLQQHGLPD